MATENWVIKEQSPWAQAKEPTPDAAEVMLPAMDMSPDDAAKAAEQSRRFSVPPTLLAGAPDPDLQRRAEIEDAGKQLEASPKLKNWVSQQTSPFAAIVRDDLENMSKMDQAIHGFGDYVLRTIGGEGMGRLQQGVYGGLAAPADLLAWGVPKTQPLADALHAASAAGGQWADTYGVAAGEYSGIGKDVASGISSMWNSLLLMPLGVEQQGAQALTKLAQFALPSIKALLPMGLQTAGLEYQNATDAGLGGGQAALYAGQQGAIEMVTEALPFGQLLHDAKFGSPFLATLGKQLIEENLGEQVATHWQDLNEWLYLHPEKSVGDYLSERKDVAISTAIATTFATGLQTGLFTAAARGMRNDDRDKEAADRAAQHAEILANLGKLSSASQVRQRDMQTFESYVQSVADGSPVESVYISANALMQSGKAEKLAELSPTVAEQLNDAIATGGDIRIPVAEVFGRLGDNAADLLPDLKTGPNEFTAREAEAYQKDQGEALKVQVEKILQDQSGDLEFTASRDRVSAQITEKLNSLGRFTDPVNKIKGDFLAAYMGVQARNLGVTPEEFAAKYMPTFVGSEQAGIEQPAYHGTVHEIKGRFDLSKVGTGEGAQAYGWGLYFADHKSVASSYSKVGRIDPMWGSTIWSESARNKLHALSNEAIQNKNEAAQIVYDESILGDFPPETLRRHIKENENLSDEQKAQGYAAVDVVKGMLESKGQLYAVDLPDDVIPKMLDWDKPVSQQPHIAALLNLRVEKNPDPLPGEDFAVMATILGEEVSVNAFKTKKEALNYVEKAEGGDIYESLSYQFGPKGLSKTLGDAGIPGIRYDDQFSRNTENLKTRNSVVWDQNVLDRMSEGMSNTLKQRVSTRLPTALKAKENPLESNLVVGLESAKMDPKTFSKNIALIRQYPNFRDNKSADTDDKAAEQFIDHVTSNLLWLFDQVPAETRARSKLWYDGALAIATRWESKFNISREQISAVMATLSPQKDWFQNVSVAERILAIMSEHQKTLWSLEMQATAEGLVAITPEQLDAVKDRTLSEIEDSTLQAVWLRVYDETYNNRGFRLVTPEGDFGPFSTNKDGSETATAWGSFGEMGKAISVFKDGSIANISEQLGDQHKVRNFYNNIYDPASEHGDVTIDTHAVAAALLRPLSGKAIEVNHNFGGMGASSSSVFGSKGTYGLYAEAYRRAAAQRGVLAREMQSITWEAIRGLYPAKFKAQAKNVEATEGVWNLYKKRRISLNEARTQILELAGGITPPEWSGHDLGDHEAPWGSSYTSELRQDERTNGAAGRGARSGAAAGTDAVDGTLKQSRFAPGSKLARGAEAVQQVRSNRQSSGEASWSYSREDGVRGTLWSPGEKLASELNAAGVTTPVFEELPLGDVPSAEKFTAAIQASKAKSGAVGAAVFVYPTETYAKMRLFLSEDGKTGVGIKDDGDIVSVFSNAGAGRAAMELAVAAGGTKLDAFDTILPEFYSAHGFVETGRDPWNEEYKPDGWDKTTFADYNGGEPDVVYMKLDQGSGLLEQQARGSFDPTTRTLALLAAADLSTFFHESAHYFLDLQATIASQPGAPVRVVEDLDKLLQWFGVEGATPDARLAAFNAARTALNDSITGTAFDAALAAKATKWHEAMAESFEQYLREGKAPSIELQGVFRSLRAWLKWVYKTVTDMYRVTKDPKYRLNDEVRLVFDRLLASDEEIAVARVGAKMNQLFETPEEAAKFGLDWEAYHKLAESDVDAAQEELAGKAVRDLKWLDNARSRMLKKLQAEGAEVRKVVRDRISEQVKSYPVYRAMRWLRSGEMTTEDGEEIKAEKGFRLNTDAIREMFPASGLDNLEVTALRGMTASDGLHPDLVAEMFGYSSGQQLIKEILAAQPMKDVIEGMTDQRMLEDHSELSDPQTMQESVNRAIYNQAHAKVLAAELGALEKALAGKTKTGTDKNGRTTSTRTLPKAAKEFAEQLVARVKVKDLNPAKYEAAAKRAAAEATKAMKAGKLEEAATAKRNELVNNYASQAAREAQAQITQAEKLFRKVLTGADAKIVKSRDLGLVNAARAVLSQFGFGGKAKSAMPYLELVRQYDPDTYNAVEASVRAAQDNAKPFETMTLEEVAILYNEIDALWNMARRMKVMEIDGNKMDRDELATEINNRLEQIGVPENGPGTTSAVTPMESLSLQFASIKAGLKRVESWVDVMDGPDKNGVFRRYIWNPIKLAADRYRADKVTHLRAFRTAFDEIAPTVKRGLIEAPELNYIFGKDSGGVALNEILHALLHTGNESNKRKLLLGRGWAVELENGTLDTTRWDLFLDRMIAEGHLTKQHFDFVQTVWDRLEQMKPGAQEAHRDAYGKYFDEVTADSFTNKFGTYRGGYVPAMVDGRIVKDNELKRLMEEGKEGMSYAFPGTSKGFTQKRTEYNKPMLLDLRTLPMHIDKVLKFTHLENPVRDVAKLLNDKRVSTPLNTMQPETINGMLQPWLTRAASQQVSTPMVGLGGLSKLFNTLRNRTGMATMFANLSNTAQQITGFALAGVVVKPSHLLSATAAYMKSPRKATALVASLSTYMDGRINNEVDALLGEVDAILLDPNVYESAVNWSKRHQYFMQSAVDNVMGPIIWMGAYNQALEENFDTVTAARQADAAIRQTQGSTMPEDVSRAETGPAYLRLFTQFASYFNMQANLLGSSFAKIPAELGMRQKVGRGFYIGLMGFAIPAILAEAIAQAFRGGPGDEDKDGEYLDDWLMSLLVYGPMRNVTAFVPGLGQLVNSTVARFTDNPLDDRISVGAAVGALERSASVPNDLYKLAIGEGKAEKTLRDVGTLVTLVTGLPIATLTKPVSYVAGVVEGATDPTSNADFARGLVSGTASKDSRN